MRILHLEPSRYPDDAKSKLAKLGEVDFVECHRQEELIQLVRDKAYDAVFAKLGLAFDTTFFEAVPALKYLVTPTTGLNHINLDAAESAKVQVLSLKGETELLNQVKSTAEHTWALLLMLTRNLQGATQHVEAGGWQREPFMATELDGKTIGVLGLGRLGRIIAKYAAAFGMKVMAYDIRNAAFTECETLVERVSLREVFSKADVLSLHIPSNPETHHFVNQEKLSWLPAHAVLINTARGEVIDERALLSALQNNRLAGAAIDVLEGDSTWEEQVEEEHALVAFAKMNKNLLITPHMGGYGIDSIYKTRRFMVDKLLAEVTGG